MLSRAWTVASSSPASVYGGNDGATAPPRRSNENKKKKKEERKAKTPRRAVSLRMRVSVWREHCGSGLDGRCVCCSEPLRFEDMHLGHVVAHRNGGSSARENLRPVCRGCNLAMGTRDMRDYAAGLVARSYEPMEIG